MNYFNRSKWAAITVVILFIANVVTLIFFWVIKVGPIAPPPPPEAPAGAHSPAMFISKELNLNAEQQKQFDTLRKEHQSQVRVIRDSIRLAKDAFFSLINRNVTDIEIQSAAAKAAIYQQQLDLLTFNHFKKLKSICTPAQQQHFDEIIGKVIEQIAPPAPGAPPRPGARESPPPPPPPAP